MSITDLFLYSRRVVTGPFNIPLLGSWELIRLWLSDGSLTELYARLGERYGPVIFLRTALDAPVVVIRQYDALKVSTEHSVTFCPCS